MSLSQKHSGKILVPWFNKSEWKAVHDLLADASPSSLIRAVQIMQIWKLRTPLLSAGVEGTMILLEALLMDHAHLSDHQVSHVYSTCLVRFLNLCAANSDKQGSFYKTAMKNQLPDWLVTLRHDIAHGHKIPSRSMLEMSLNYCLAWTKKRYWQAHREKTSDLIIEDDKDEHLLHELIRASVALNSNNDSGQLSETVLKSLEKTNKNRKQSATLSKRIAKLLTETMRNDVKKALSEIQSLISDGTFLTTTHVINSKGVPIIPETFQLSWRIFLNSLNESRILLELIWALFNFLIENTHDNQHRLIASLWIRNIFLALNANPGDGNAIVFAKKYSHKDPNFVTEILNKPNEFTCHFLKEVLDYHEAPQAFIQDSLALLEALTVADGVQVSEILTVNSLKLEAEHSNQDGPPENRIEEATTTWSIIKDSSTYKNLPLGILPHQSRRLNPVLCDLLK